MENNKTITAIKIYGILGKSLAGCAGAILGYMIAGPFLAIPGIIVGVIVGELLERCVVDTSHKSA